MRRRTLIATLGAAALAACAPRSASAVPELGALYAHPARDQWPPELTRLPADVQEMYRYAVANEATLKWMPCTCGCVAGGHESNFDCYVRAVLPDGRVQLDTMSFG